MDSCVFFFFFFYKGYLQMNSLIGRYKLLITGGNIMRIMLIGGPDIFIKRGGA